MHVSWRNSYSSGGGSRMYVCMYVCMYMSGIHSVENSLNLYKALYSLKSSEMSLPLPCTYRMKNLLQGKMDSSSTKSSVLNSKSSTLL